MVGGGIGHICDENALIFFMEIIKTIKLTPFRPMGYESALHILILVQKNKNLMKDRWIAVFPF